MAKKKNNGTFKDLLEASLNVFGIVVGLVGQGLLQGLGFWLAFYLIMK